MGALRPRLSHFEDGENFPDNTDLPKSLRAPFCIYTGWLTLRHKHLHPHPLMVPSPSVFLEFQARVSALLY